MNYISTRLSFYSQNALVEQILLNTYNHYSHYNGVNGIEIFCNHGLFPPEEMIIKIIYRQRKYTITFNNDTFNFYICYKRARRSNRIVRNSIYIGDPKLSDYIIEFIDKATTIKWMNEKAISNMEIT